MNAGNSPLAATLPARGFTLIELLVSIVLLVILVSIGVPSFAEIIRNNRVTAQGNELLTALLYARSEAVRTRQDIHVVVDEPADAGWGALVCVTTACDDAGDPVREIDFSATPVTASLTSGSLPLTVSFNALGRAVLDPAGTDLIFEHNDCIAMQRRRVTISATGRVEIAPEACGI